MEVFKKPREWVLSPLSSTMACPTGPVIGLEPRWPTNPAAWRMAANIIAYLAEDGISDLTDCRKKASRHSDSEMNENGDS